MKRKERNPIIENDIMRYKKNKLSGNLALLSLVFECLYFMVMYGQIAGDIKATFYEGGNVYTYLTGLSVIINLVLLLVIFLSSEELKGYNMKFCYVVLGIAAFQIIRIFGYPMTTYSNVLSNGRDWVFGEGTLIELIIFLVASAACLIGAGITGIINITRLNKFKAELEKGQVDLVGALAEETANSAKVETKIAAGPTSEGEV